MRIACDGGPPPSGQRRTWIWTWAERPAACFALLWFGATSYALVAAWASRRRAARLRTASVRQGEMLVRPMWIPSKSPNRKREAAAPGHRVATIPAVIGPDNTSMRRRWSSFPWTQYFSTICEPPMTDVSVRVSPSVVYEPKSAALSVPE